MHALPARSATPRTDRSNPARREQSKTRFALSLLAAVLGPLVLLAAIVGVVFFVQRDGHSRVAEDQPDAASSSSPPPLVIIGVSLRDGPLVDPTDTLHLSRERVAVGKDLVDVRLLGIIVRGASNGRVDLDATDTSLTYQFLVIHRDARASKAEERRGERVELTLQRIAPQTTRMDVPPTTRTAPEPLCVWSAAWSAAVASGLSSSATMDAVYGLDAQNTRGIWTFTPRDQPKMARVIDGQTCAIKTARP